MASDNIYKSTIMFTDIVGYSAIVDKNQSHAMELLSMHDKIIEPIIKENNGTIIKKIGDAIFAEYSNAPESIQAAQKTQVELAKRNIVCNPKDQIVIRIGLHIGNVIRKDDDLFGHDVNLCSRIESIAPIGGIAGSAELIASLPDTSDCPHREMGYVKLKNITQPQKLYKIYSSKENHELESSSQLQEYLIDNGIDIIDMDSYKVRDTFSLAVLYTANIGTDKNESIAYSITEELINDFAYIETVRLCGFNDVVQFNKSELHHSDIGRKLQVDNIISGSILPDGESIKLNFQLLNINSGKVLWSDSWTDLIVNSKNIRKHIINGALQSFNIEIPNELADSLSEEMSTNSDAIHEYNKGKACSLEFLEKKSDLDKAKEHFKTAISLDHNFVEAYYLLSVVSERMGNYDEAESALNTGLDIANKKNNLRGKSHIHRGFYILYLRWGKNNQAIEHIEKALKIEMAFNNPLFEAQLRLDYANCLNKLQNYDLSIEQNKQAIDILKTIEDDRLIGLSYANLCDSYLIKGDYSSSIEYGEKSIAKFKKLNMTNNIAITCNWTAEPYCKSGLYSKMYKKAIEAENLIAGLNDFFREGKVEYFKTYYALSQNDYDAAINHIDLSIDKFNLSKNTVQEIQSSIEKIKILIELNKFDKASIMVAKVNHLINQIKGSYANDIFTAITYYVGASNASTDKILLDKFLKALNDIKDYSFAEVYWYLARSYHALNHNDLALECHVKSKIILDNRCQIISNPDHQESYRNTFYNKRILSDLQKDKTEAEKDEIKLFVFCPSCGFKNENNFDFCPSCGNDLKQ